jgi:hypothetical protein
MIDHFGCLDRSCCIFRRIVCKPSTHTHTFDPVLRHIDVLDGSRLPFACPCANQRSNSVYLLGFLRKWLLTLRGFVRRKEASPETLVGRRLIIAVCHACLCIAAVGNTFSSRHLNISICILKRDHPILIKELRLMVADHLHRPRRIEKQLIRPLHIIDADFLRLPLLHQQR